MGNLLYDMSSEVLMQDCLTVLIKFKKPKLTNDYKLYMIMAIRTIQSEKLQQSWQDIIIFAVMWHLAN